MRVLTGGLILILPGLFCLVTQACGIPAEVWWTYFMAGLGAALVIGGVVGYSRSQFLGQESQPAQGRGRAWRSKASSFSSQLGIEHDALFGKNILLEFDPSTQYERVLKDFAPEFAFNKGAGIVLTPSGSVIQHALEGRKGVRVISVAPDTMLSPSWKSIRKGPLR